MTWNERIIIDPNVLDKKPVIKGTRLTADFIIDLLASGWTEQEVLDNYPILKHEDILACLAYANLHRKGCASQ